MPISTRNWGDEFTKRAVTAASNKMNRLRTEISGDLSKQRIADAGAMARTRVSEAGATQRQGMGDQTQIGVQNLRNTGALAERGLAEKGANNRARMDQYQFELKHQLEKKRLGQFVREYDQDRRDKFMTEYMRGIGSEDNYDQYYNKGLNALYEQDRLASMSPEERERSIIENEISKVEQDMQGLSGRDRLEYAKGLDPEVRKALGYTDEFIAKYDKTFAGGK